MSESQGTVIVTGGSRGIRATISRLAAGSRPRGRRQLLFRQIFRRAAAIPADVGEECRILRLSEISDKTLGSLRSSNAAITDGFARVDSVEAAMCEHQMAVHVTSAILCAREAVRRVATKHGGTGGAIVNIPRRAARFFWRIGPLSDNPRRNWLTHRRSRPRGCCGWRPRQRRSTWAR